jgi:glycosyltransferase involved in cell wall biosynthesis
VTRILYICSSWPHGRSFGGQIRSLHICRALRTVGDVDVLMVGSEAGDREAQERTAREFSTLPPIEPRLTGRNGLGDRVRRAFDTRFLDLHGFACTAADQARIDALLGRYDLVWLLNSRTPNLIQRWSWPRSHLDIDDLPSTYLRSHARSVAGLGRRLKLQLQQRLMHRRELRLGERFPSLSVCSREDRDYLRNDRIHVIPNGFERPAAMPVRNLNPQAPRLGFIGLYSYEPNRAGMQWFLRECWPQVRRAVPGVRLRLIGRDTDGPLRPDDPDVEALGWVADPAAEIASWSAMIVPILFGGGTRIKIAEAFSRRCPAVSTPTGAFGYAVEHGRQLLLAESGQAFADSCVALLRDSAAGERLANQAWADFLSNWTWEAIGERVRTAAQAALALRAAAPHGNSHLPSP